MRSPTVKNSMLSFLPLSLALATSFASSAPAIKTMNFSLTDKVAIDLATDSMIRLSSFLGAFKNCSGSIRINKVRIFSDFNMSEC